MQLSLIHQGLAVLALVATVHGAPLNSVRTSDEASSLKTSSQHKHRTGDLPVIIIPPSDNDPSGTPTIFTPSSPTAATNTTTSASPAATTAKTTKTTTTTTATATATATRAPTGTPHPAPANGTAAFDESLVPSFGVTANTNPDAQQRGSCDGFNGAKIVLIPCTCPPDRAAFLAKLRSAVAAGRFLDEPIDFPATPAANSQGSAAANRARATSMLVVLQSFSGAKGVGCPAASAPNFIEMQRSGVFVDGTFIT